MTVLPRDFLLFHVYLIRHICIIKSYSRCSLINNNYYNVLIVGVVLFVDTLRIVIILNHPVVMSINTSRQRSHSGNGNVIYLTTH